MDNGLVVIVVIFGVWLGVGLLGARLFGAKRVSQWTNASDGIGTSYGSPTQFVFAWPVLLLGFLVIFVVACVRFAATGKWRWF